MSARERFPHPSKECFILLNGCEISQSTPFGASVLAATPPSVYPFGAQSPCWHIVMCLALIPFVIVKATTSRYCPLWTFSFGLPLKVFKTRLLGRGFHILIKNVLFPSTTDVGSHNPLPLGPSVLAGTPPSVYPLQDSVSSLAHRPMSDSDTICKSPVHH